ncbi:hypothetical protein A3Q56_06415 [Intoshia linei]|uniref:Vacuolar protein sorting-associated protein 35 n=1 Tax=Intoshia linei TaxID=1819745 RepID=A0A177AWI9_9BILA|nr:hypothetical protein A3Q56_06415 [Intoshia linei]
MNKTSLTESVRQAHAEGLKLKSSLEGGYIVESILNASNVAFLLKINDLNTKDYFQLFLSVTEQLDTLKKFLIAKYGDMKNESETEKPLDRVYYLAQDIKLVIPRLYVTLVVGTAHYAIYKDITVLFDMIDMCRCAQEPQRGIFVRNFFLKCLEFLMPKRKKEVKNENKSNDTENEIIKNESEMSNQSNEDDIVYDWISLFLINFREMNKLWLRMNYDGHTRDRSIREQSRLDVSSLIAANICYLSQLSFINFNTFFERILPDILLQLISCQDSLAQSCILECIFEVFDVEYHIKTLQVTMDAISKFSSGLSIPVVITPLITKLANSSILNCVDCKFDKNHIFEIFSEKIAILQTAHSSIRLSEIISIKLLTMKLAFSIYTNDISIPDKILGETVQILNSGSTLNKSCENTRSVVAELVMYLIVHLKQVLVLENFKLLIFGGPWCNLNDQISAVIEILRNISSFSVRGRLSSHDFFEKETNPPQTDKMFCLDSAALVEKISSFSKVFFSLNSSDTLMSLLYSILQDESKTNAEISLISKNFNSMTVLQLLSNLIHGTEHSSDESDFLTKKSKMLNMWIKILKNESTDSVTSVLCLNLYGTLIHKYIFLIKENYESMFSDYEKSNTDYSDPSIAEKYIVNVRAINDTCRKCILNEIKEVEPKLAFSLLISFSRGLITSKINFDIFSEMAFDCVCDCLLLFDENTSEPKHQEETLVAIINLLTYNIDMAIKENSEIEYTLSETCGFLDHDIETIIAQIQSRVGRLINKSSQIYVLSCSMLLCAKVNKENLIFEKITPRIIRILSHFSVQSNKELLMQLQLKQLSSLVHIKKFRDRFTNQITYPQFDEKISQRIDIIMNEVAETNKIHDDENLFKKIETKVLILKNYMEESN